MFITAAFKIVWWLKLNFTDTKVIKIAWIWQLFVLSYYVALCSEHRDVYRIQMMFGSSLPSFVCRRTHALCTLFVFVCVWWCPTHILLCYCYVFHRLVYPMLPVSLECPFLIAPSVFSNVYLVWVIGCIICGHLAPDIIWMQYFQVSWVKIR
jgi:hypothetical protein